MLKINLESHAHSTGDFIERKYDVEILQGSTGLFEIYESGASKPRMIIAAPEMNIEQLRRDFSSR